MRTSRLLGDKQTYGLGPARLSRPETFHSTAKRPNDRFGSWLRDNALTQPATVHDPVNVVGRSEQFFPVGRSGAASESSWGMLGRVWLKISTQWGLAERRWLPAPRSPVVSDPSWYSSLRASRSNGSRCRPRPAHCSRRRPSHAHSLPPRQIAKAISPQ